MKSQNFKNHDFARFEEICLYYCLLYEDIFIEFFRSICILTYIYMYIQLVCYLDFQRLRKDLGNLFPRCQKINFRKKQILAIFCIIFQKIDVISDAIIPIATILKKIFYHFFCNFAKYGCVKFND